MHTIETNALNLDGYDVIDFEPTKYDYIYTIEPSERPYMCLQCSRFDTKLTRQQKNTREVTDVSMQGHRVLLRVIHRQYHCSGCGRYFWEALNGIRENAKITDRLRTYIKEQGAIRQFSEIADEVGISGETVGKYFKEVAATVKAKMNAPRILGIDEVYLHRKPCAVFVDMDNHKLIDILDNNLKETVKAFILALEGHEHIAAVTMDMNSGYKYAVKEVIPQAYPVIDKFHVVAKAEQVVLKYYNSIKRSANKDEQGYLWRLRRPLLKGCEKLDQDTKNRLTVLFVKYPVLGQAYRIKEDLRDVYNAKDVIEANIKLNNWNDSIPKGVAHFSDVKKTVKNCRKELVNYFNFPGEKLNNGLVESLNNNPKDLIRMGNNFDFETMRAKLLLKQDVAEKPPLKKGNPSRNRKKKSKGDVSD